jgi:hypothetical protein
MNSKKIKFGKQEEENYERNNQENSSAQNRRGSERHPSKPQQY